MFKEDRCCWFPRGICNVGDFRAINQPRASLCLHPLLLAGRPRDAHLNDGIHRQVRGHVPCFPQQLGVSLFRRHVPRAARGGRVLLRRHRAERAASNLRLLHTHGTVKALLQLDDTAHRNSNSSGVLRSAFTGKLLVRKRSTRKASKQDRSYVPVPGWSSWRDVMGTEWRVRERRRKGLREEQKLAAFAQMCKECREEQQGEEGRGAGGWGQGVNSKYERGLFRSFELLRQRRQKY